MSSTVNIVEFGCAWFGVGFGVLGLGCGVLGSDFTFHSVFRVTGVEFRVPGFGFRVSGSGFPVSGVGVRVQGFGATMASVHFAQGGGVRQARLETILK